MLKKIVIYIFLLIILYFLCSSFLFNRFSSTETGTYVKRYIKYNKNIFGDAKKEYYIVLENGKDKKTLQCNKDLYNSYGIITSDKIVNINNDPVGMEELCMAERSWIDYKFKFNCTGYRDVILGKYKFINYQPDSDY